MLNVFVSLQGYSTLPGYGKETVRPITIWKGNSFTTISARDPHISGKDSGKGDSDFNDSDSDISGDVHKKESPPTNSECHTNKIETLRWMSEMREFESETHAVMNLIV